MLLIVGICIGFVLGMSVVLCILRKGSVGNLVIADDGDDGMYLFLEIAKTDIKKLWVQCIVKLNVVDKRKIPHK